MDWQRIGRRVALGVYLVVATFFAVYSVLEFTPPSKYPLFVDAQVYYHATETWLAGGNPWTGQVLGVSFSAPPPALLLNVPLQPFGADVAVAFWAIASLAAIAYLFRRLRLPWWMLLFAPIIEGWCAGSPDLTLAALVVAGWGGLSAVAKPYAVPALIAERRWFALYVAAAIFVLTSMLLPWGTFIESRQLVAEGLAEVARTPSAWGEPLLMLATIVALVSLGWKSGMELTIPGLLAMQPHYMAFSLKPISRSLLLATFCTIPIPHLAAFGVIAYAAWTRRSAVARGTRRSRSSSRMSRSWSP